MPLFYRARQSQLKTKEGKKQWHLTLVKVGKMVTSQQLAEVIAEKSSLTPPPMAANKLPRWAASAPAGR